MSRFISKKTKKIINDTWADVDSRYIINDFLNTTVNYNSTLDNLSYANATAIRAEWIEANDGDNPNVDSSDFFGIDIERNFWMDIRRRNGNVGSNTNNKRHL